jgi:hypothetical protein
VFDLDPGGLAITVAFVIFALLIPTYANWIDR